MVLKLNTELTVLYREIKKQNILQLINRKVKTIYQIKKKWYLKYKYL